MRSRSGGVLVLTYWSLRDPLIVNYTLPYLRIMRGVLPADRDITLVTLERGSEGRHRDVLPLEPGISRISLPLFPFGPKAVFAWAISLVVLARLVGKRRITTIHAWCTPAGAIGYLLARLTRRELVIDSFEPHAESMVETGTWSRRSVPFLLLSRLERWQTHYASSLIAAAPGMDDYARRVLGYGGGAIPVKPACVDLEVFSLERRGSERLISEFDLAGKVVLVYSGKFGGLYLEDEVFRFFRACYEEWGDDLAIIVLSSTPKEWIFEMAKSADVPMSVLRVALVEPSEVPEVLGVSDFALTPVKPVPSKRYCSPVKDGEYWAMGLPVVITEGISNDSDLIEEFDAGVVLRSFDDESMRLAVKHVAELIGPSRVSATRARVRSLAETHRNFEQALKIYRDLYGRNVAES